MEKRSLSLILALVMVSILLLGTSVSAATIKMWSKGSGTDPAMEAVIDAFMEEYPEHKVIYEAYGENYANVVKMALAAGDAPDIFENGGNFPVQVLAEQGLIVPVDDVITGEMKENMYQPIFSQKDISYNGQMYTIPTRVSAFRLLYNKDLFKAAGLDPEQPPKTMAEVREMAKKITEAGQGKFYGFGLYLGSANIWERVLDPVAVAGGSSALLGFDFGEGKFDFSNNAKILEVFVDIAKDGSIFPGYETLAVDPMRANFAQGNVGMYFDGNWSSGMYATQIKTDINWETAAVPVMEGESYGLGASFPGVDFAVSASSKNQELAKTFLRYMITHSEIMQQNKPEPKTYLPANRVEALPVEELNLQGVKMNFKLDDLAPLPQLVHYVLSLEGDNRDKVFTSLFLRLVNGDSLNVKREVERLNKRYNKALEEAIEDGFIAKEDIEIPGFKLENR